MSAARFDAVVFDLDGTLVDSAQAMRKIAAQLMAELGAEPLTLDEVKRFVGNGAPVFLDRALAARGIEADAAERAAHLARFRALYAAAPGSDNPPFAGAEAALDALAAAGLALGLCTNKPAEPTRNLLDALGWTDRFASVVAGDTLPVPKPDPSVPRRVLEELGARRALYVGDSETDEATAKAGRMTFALYARGYRKKPASAFAAALVFEEFDALVDFALGR